MSIKELIEKADLSESVDKEVTFEDKYIPYTIARKKHKFVGEKTYSYAEYYLLELNDVLKSLILNYKKFMDFQVKFLAPYFYKYANDLRWNLYVIFLIKDDEFLSNVDIGAIENDDNYARKFFFNYVEAEKFLKRDELVINNDNYKNKGLKSGQFQQWVEILDNVQLTGCLTDAKLRNENVERYVDTGSFEDTAVLDGSSSSNQNETINMKHVDKLEALDIGKFREHCFQGMGKISFGQVNLLQGPNGCGKTSITEGIELAITNDIKRLKDIKEDVGRYDGLKAKLKSASILKEYYPGQTSTIYKQIDSEWYGVPNVDRSQTTLNKNFNRFNYLDADAASRFTREQSLNSNEAYDYRDGLKKLFFDNETVNMEKRWIWYNDKFIEKQGKLEKEYNLLNQKRLDEDGNLKRLENNSSPNIEEIISLALAINYINTLYQPGENLKLLHALDETVKAIDNTIGKLVDTSKTNKINCYNDIVVKEVEIKKNLESIENNINKILDAKKNLILEIEELTKKAENEIRIKHKNDKEIERLESDIQLWQDIKRVIINSSRIDDLKRFTDSMEKNQKKLSLISDIKIKNFGIEKIKEEEILSYSLIDTKRCQEEINSLEEEKVKVDKRIKELSYTAGQLGSLKAKLKALGEEYVQINGDDGICPLCGYPHQEKLSLLKSINSMSLQNIEIEEVKSLEKARNNIEHLISQKSELLRDEINRREKQASIYNAYKEIFESGYYELGKSGDDIKSVFANLQKILRLEDNLDTNIKRDQAMIDCIRNEGYTIEKIAIANHFKENNIRFIQFINEGKDKASYTEYMLVNKAELDKESTLIKEKLAEIEASKIDLQSRISQYEAIENTRCIEREHEKKMLQELSEINNYFIILRKHFNIFEKDDIFLWAEKFYILKTRCASEMNYLQTALTIKEIREKLKLLEGNERRVNEQITRCKIAISAFKMMPRLDDAVYDFLENNKERIIYFFQMLHRPKEFESRLEYDEKGYFKLIRKGEEGEVRCPQMSTGQRVSFTLSVFFSLHLSAVNAPSFIMLDEPVANLDDVHLLNLLDILRDFALNGIQVFFTTANQDVAGLFRRKFSFFENEFIHLRFERMNNLPVTIKQITYNPIEDAGKETLLQTSFGK